MLDHRKEDQAVKSMALCTPDCVSDMSNMAETRIYPFRFMN